MNLNAWRQTLVVSSIYRQIRETIWPSRHGSCSAKKQKTFSNNTNLCSFWRHSGNTTCETPFKKVSVPQLFLHTRAVLVGSGITCVYFGGHLGTMMAFLSSLPILFKCFQCCFHTTDVLQILMEPCLPVFLDCVFPPWPGLSFNFSPLSPSFHWFPSAVWVRKWQPQDHLFLFLTWSLNGASERSLKHTHC